MRGFSVLAALFTLFVLHGAPSVADPLFSPDGPNAEAYGRADGYPFARRGQSLTAPAMMIGSFSHFDLIFPTRRVQRGDTVSALKRGPDGFNPSYSHRGESHTLDDYLARHPAMGVLIAKGDTILAERYQYDRKDTDRFASQSMAKTITAMLIGLAVSDGAIRSIDDKAEDYVPALKGNAYGETPIRALLHMSSGVAHTEDYSGHDDHARFVAGMMASEPKDKSQVIARFNERTAAPGTHFNYASIETEVLGLVLHAAIKRPLADYLSERIWRPMGAEADANWVIDSGGNETGFCCFSATLRDYARLGLLLARGGEAQGQQLIPRDWIVAATTTRPEDDYLAPRKATGFYGYGYQVWLMPGPRRMFALLGVHGQAILVDPQSSLVLVHTAARILPSKDPAAAELISLWLGLIKLFGG